jgi:parallel beta-helix repeat protein
MARVRLNWEGETVADRYRITNRLGEGGMGTVYRATDLQSGKTVALKTPRIALLEDPAFFKRFQREMQALLQLRHPYIVPVLDVGEHKRIPFFVMPYLSGGNLRQRLKEKLARGPDDLFPWLAQIAAALDYLHAQNVVHRDVKPDNVLFDEQGVAYLTDLGAVKVQEGSSVDARTKLTATGTALGTPPYMAPELILGRPYDGRADQYALAVIVYEAFTGQHPYDASSLGALIQSLQGPEAERLDSRCGAPTGVAEAVARGLARDPNQRFPSCTEFAKAVRVGFVRSPATLKSPARPSGAGAAAGDRPAPRVMPAVPAGTPPPVIAPAKARAASGDTPAPVGPGLAPKVTASPLPAEPGGVSRAEGFGSPADALPAPAPLRRIMEQEPTPLQGLKRTLSQPVVLSAVVAGGVFITGMLLLAMFVGHLRSSPDSAQQVPGSEPSPDPAGTATVPTGPTGGSESRPPMNRGGLDTLPSPSIEPGERIWRVGQNNLTFEQAVARALPGDTIEVPAGRFTLTQSVLVNKSLTIRGAGPDKTTLLSWEPDFAIRFTGDCQWTLENLSLEHVGNKPADVVIIDSGVITIRNCHFSGAVSDPTTEKEVRRFTEHKDMVETVAVTPDGKYVVSGSRDNTVRLWELATGQEVRRFMGHADWVSSVAVTPDGKYVVSGSKDKTARVWDLATGQEVRRFTGHNNWVSSVAVTRDGRHVVSGSVDNTVRLWELATGKEVRRFTGHEGTVLSVAVTPDGKYVVSGSWDHTVRLWELATGKEVRRFTGHVDAVWSVAVTPDGKYAVSGSKDNTVRLWDLATGQEVRRYTGHTRAVRSVAMTPSSKYIVSGSGDNTVRLWDLATGKEVRRFTGHVDAVWCVAVTPDGKYVVSGSWDKTVRLWDIGEKAEGVGTGIRLMGTARGMVSNCVCRNNGLHGIALSGQTQPTLEGNTCESNEECGIAYFDSAGGTARNNTCRKNGYHGIQVSDQAQPTLEANTCEGNKDMRHRVFRQCRRHCA